MGLGASKMIFKSILDANLVPNGVHVGAKLVAKSDPLLHVLSKLILDRILEPPGVDFGRALESKLSSERDIN